MKPENSEQSRVKLDFVVAQKKVASQTFSIEKDKVESSFFSWIICFILILISCGLVFTYLYINREKANIKESVDVTTLFTSSTFTYNSVSEKISTFKVISAKYTVPTISKAVGIYELNSGKAIFEQSADQKLSFASITKLLTVSTMESLYSDKEIFTMDPIAANVTGSLAGLTVGEKYSFTDALYGMMLPSGNDIAYSVASHDSYENFILAMQKIVSALNLPGTSISNPIGYDDPDHHFSSIRDIFTMSRLYLSRDLNREVAKAPEYNLKTSDGKTYNIVNTNELLIRNEVFGLKTGTTDLAGQCLVLYIKIQDREYVAVILGSQNRFKEGDNIVNWLKSYG